MASTRLAALGLAAGLVGGGTIGAAVGLAAVSGAQTATDAPTTEAPVPDALADVPRHVERPAPGAHISDALQGLVDDGTLTEEQRQAVMDVLAEARPDGRNHHPREHGAGGPGLEAAADALGMTQDELRAAVGPDTSLADVATERSVDVQTVIDAIVAARRAEIAEKVADGSLPQAQADELLESLEERVTAFVNGERPPHEGKGRHAPK